MTVATDISRRVRAEVARRAGYCCEYCLIPESEAGFAHQIDHVLSRRHGGSSDITNLAYACIFCNRHKGSDAGAIDPKTGEVVRLFNPRRDRSHDHFRVDDTGHIEALSAIGIATIRLLRLNVADRVTERRILRTLKRR